MCVYFKTNVSVDDLCSLLLIELDFHLFLERVISYSQKARADSRLILPELISCLSLILYYIDKLVSQHYSNSIA